MQKTRRLTESAMLIAIVATTLIGIPFGVTDISMSSAVSFFVKTIFFITILLEKSKILLYNYNIEIGYFQY